MTAAALAWYALGVPAYGLVKGLSQGYYSVQDTRTPVKLAAVSMVANIGLNLALMGPLGLRGLALATSLAAWLNVAMLARGLSGAVGAPLPLASVAGTAVRAVVASAAMGIASVAALAGVAALLPGDAPLLRAARVAAAVTAGVVALLAVYRVLRHAEMREILENLPGVRRRP
jgi:putative peptidoglycan lipid II flippase